MKNNLALGLLILTALFFTSCDGGSSSGSSSNKDFVGTWYTDDNGDITKLEFTDSTYMESEKESDDSDYSFDSKGIVKIASKGIMEITVTHIFINIWMDKEGYVKYMVDDWNYTESAASEEAEYEFYSEIMNYSVSIDQSSLIFGNGAYSTTYTSLEP
ncbi:MAG: hypothetical protein B6241_11265 [Spirochaetaceae bacterium 4572_59]|nr:MAG: hypothetical protein B6241_11265 [Spirochaetaceae bacterium 4572_59]